MQLVRQFICDVCNQPIPIKDGIVIWNERRYPAKTDTISLFIVHNSPKCRTPDTHEECPLNCTLRGFIASQGLREYFSLLVAEEDYPVSRMKHFVEKGLISLDSLDFTPKQWERPVVQTEADLAVRRAALKRSIAQSVSRFFDDFDENAYFMNDKELSEAMRQDLAGEGPVYI
jgi:hypothetical protein